MVEKPYREAWNKALSNLFLIFPLAWFILMPFQTRLKFIIAALTMMVLCNTAFRQTTAKDWFDKGVDLSNQSRYDEVTNPTF